MNDRNESLQANKSVVHEGNTLSPFCDWIEMTERQGVGGVKTPLNVDGAFPAGAAVCLLFAINTLNMSLTAEKQLAASEPNTDKEI